MSLSYCTLFDAYYLSRGLVLCESFLRNTSDSLLYVLAMDDLTYEVLIKENLDRVVTIKFDDFMNDELKVAKNNRTHAEFCWTCTASLIKYVITRYNAEICTYVDSDLYFYDNPDVLVERMIEKNKSVQIIPHGFSKSFLNKIQEKASGTYCVEFNSFRNDEEGMSILDEWVSNTIESCEYGTKGACGDQMYLNEWPEKYKCVNVLDYPGAGVAPWNINRYRINRSGKSIRELCVDGKDMCKLYFYHFHGITDVEKQKYNIHVFYRYWSVDSNLVYSLYDEYLTVLENCKNHLSTQYHIDNRMPVHPATKAAEKKKPSYSFGKYIRRIIIKIYTLKNRHRDIVSV